MNSVKLTLEQRYKLIRFIGRNPCTITVRLTVDALIDQLVLNDEERAAGYTVEIVDGVAKPNNTEYTREYTADMLGPTLEGVRDFVKYLDEIIKETNGGSESSREIRDALALLRPIFPKSEGETADAKPEGK